MNRSLSPPFLNSSFSRSLSASRIVISPSSIRFRIPGFHLSSAETCSTARVETPRKWLAACAADLPEPLAPSCAEGFVFLCPRPPRCPLAPAAICRSRASFAKSGMNFTAKATSWSRVRCRRTRFWEMAWSKGEAPLLRHCANLGSTPAITQARKRLRPSSTLVSKSRIGFWSPFCLMSRASASSSVVSIKGKSFAAGCQFSGLLNRFQFMLGAYHSGGSGQ